MNATEIWSYPKKSKSITSEQILNECAIVAAGEAVFLAAENCWGLKLLSHLSDIASGSQKISKSKIVLLFLQILCYYSHVTNNYCKHCP